MPPSKLAAASAAAADETLSLSLCEAALRLLLLFENPAR
jgi:hypothetical protein